MEQETKTVTLATWVWDVIVAVLRQKNEYGHISAAADAVESQLRHGSSDLSRLVVAVLDSLATGVLSADLDESVAPFVVQVDPSS
jgi:hypothetical protein